MATETPRSVHDAQRDDVAVVEDDNSLLGLLDADQLAMEAEVLPAAVLPKPFGLDELFAVLRRFTDCVN